MLTGNRLWIWLAGGAVLTSATGLAIYFAQSPARASGEESLPLRAATSTVQPASKGEATAPDADQIPQDKRLARYDKNKNGVVEVAEFVAARRKSFDKLDSDGNGALSFEEYALKTSQKFDAADANRNGRLELTEFATTARPPAKKKCECVTEDKEER
jgi:hypothetical protein